LQEIILYLLHTTRYNLLLLQYHSIFIETIGNNDAIVAGMVQQRISSCLETLDIFLQLSSYSMISSMIVPDKKQNKKIGLVETIAAILGITDIDSVNSESLNALGMDSLKDIEVKQTLENYNIVISTEKMRTLTVSELRNLALQYSS